MANFRFPFLFWVCLWSLTVNAEAFHYPASNAAVSAGKTGASTLVIYSSTDLKAFAPVIAGFQAAYRTVAVTYYDLDSNELYERFLIHTKGTQENPPDLLLSSAMDLQIKLVNDGYALHYDSAAVRRLPHWAVWRNEAFGFSFEPVVIVYNKDLLPAAEIPYTRRALAQLLRDQPERYLGKVVTYSLSHK